MTTPLLDRFRRKTGHKRVSALNETGNYRSSDEGASTGFSNLLNLSLLAGAGTGLTAAASSPSLARLLEVVRGGLKNPSPEAEDQGSDEEGGCKMKKRPTLQATDSPALSYLDTQVYFQMRLRNKFLL